MADTTPRWVYRFDNYKRAFALRSEAMALFDERELSELEQEGVIQRFEYTWELAWKLLGDLLSAEGVTLETKTPRSVIRAAYAAKLIDNGEAWMDALIARNQMSHKYSKANFEKVVENIRFTFFDLLKQLHESVAARGTTQ